MQLRGNDLYCIDLAGGIILCQQLDFILGLLSCRIMSCGWWGYIGFGGWGFGGWRLMGFGSCTVMGFSVTVIVPVTMIPVMVVVVVMMSMTLVGVARHFLLSVVASLAIRSLGASFASRGFCIRLLCQTDPFTFCELQLVTGVYLWFLFDSIMSDAILQCSDRYT